MTKLKFVRSWRAYRTGQVADIPGGMAAELVARKIAVADTQGQLIETAAIEHQAETADATPQRRSRRGVRKPHQNDAAGG